MSRTSLSKDGAKNTANRPACHILRAFSRLTIFCGFLAGCSHGASFTPYPNAQLAQREQPLAGAAYRQIDSFKSGADGANPISGLTEINGAYYGTTNGGGTSYGWGTVFKIMPDGAEHVHLQYSKPETTARIPTPG